MSLILKEEHRLRLSKKKMLREIFGLKEWGRKRRLERIAKMRSSIVCTFSQVLVV
jgi:hypothetical protein